MGYIILNSLLKLMLWMVTLLPLVPSSRYFRTSCLKAEKLVSQILFFFFFLMGFVLAEGEIKMDLEKVGAVTNRPTPKSRKDVQRFLVFPNFFWKFTRNFRSLAHLCMN